MQQAEGHERQHVHLHLAGECSPTVVWVPGFGSCEDLFCCQNRIGSRTKTNTSDLLYDVFVFHEQ